MPAATLGPESPVKLPRARSCAWARRPYSVGIVPDPCGGSLAGLEIAIVIGEWPAPDHP